MYTLAPLVCFARVDMRLFFCLFGLAFTSSPLNDLVDDIQDLYSTTWNTLKAFSDKLGKLQKERVSCVTGVKKIPQMEMYIMKIISGNIAPRLTDFANLATPIEHLTESKLADNTAILVGECGVVIARVIYVLSTLRSVWCEIEKLFTRPIYDSAKKASRIFHHATSSLLLMTDEVITHWRILQIQYGRVKVEWQTNCKISVMYDQVSGEVSVYQTDS